MKRRIRYEIDEVTGDLRETELGLVGNDACQIDHWLEFPLWGRGVL